MSGFLGCGDVVAQRKLNGVWGDYFDLGDATKFEIKENAELKERKSKRCASYGQNLSSVPVKQPAEITITLDSLDPKGMALLFLGEDAARSITAGTVSDEPHTIGTVGNFIRTDKGNIDTVVVTDSTGAITYLAGTDYIVTNAAAGLIQIIGSTIVDGDELLVDYAHKLVTSTTIKGGNKPDVKVRLMLNGKNLDTQENVQVEVHEAVLTPQGGLDFLADDFVSYDLGGKLNYDSVKGNSYEVHTNVVNATA